jgi:hypothetical protein
MGAIRRDQVRHTWVAYHASHEPFDPDARHYSMSSRVRIERERRIWRTARRRQTAFAPRRASRTIARSIVEGAKNLPHGDTLLHPSPDAVVRPGDRVLVFGLHDQIAAFEREVRAEV